MSLVEDIRRNALDVVVDLESVEGPETVNSSCSVKETPIIVPEVVVISSENATCEVCATPKPVKEFHRFDNCGHTYCIECVERAFIFNVTESKVNLQCLNCDMPATAEEIRSILSDKVYQKYLDFTLRQYLAKTPDVVYCRAPDCSFACISICSKSNQKHQDSSKSKNKSKSSPLLDKEDSEDYFVCRREGCGHEQCLKCMEKWHANEPCKEVDRGELPQNMKPCPTCNVLILKNQDGSCNQMTCTICRTSFCWLCGQRVSEMHFLRYVRDMFMVSTPLPLLISSIVSFIIGLVQHESRSTVLYE